MYITLLLPRKFYSQCPFKSKKKKKKWFEFSKNIFKIGGVGDNFCFTESLFLMMYNLHSVMWGDHFGASPACA